MEEDFVVKSLFKIIGTKIITEMTVRP